MEINSRIQKPLKKRRGHQRVYTYFLGHFYRKWKLFQGVGNRKKNGVGQPPGCIPIFLDTFIENGNYFMDSETVKKKRRGSASRVYTYFLLTLLSKMEINSRSRKPSKKNGVGQPPGFIPICFETLLWKMETNSRIRKPSKKTAWISRVYTYFETLLSKMEIISRIRNPSKKTAWISRVYTYFETLLSKMETNSRIRKP